MIPFSLLGSPWRGFSQTVRFALRLSSMAEHSMSSMIIMRVTEYRSDFKSHSTDVLSHNLHLIYKHKSHASGTGFSSGYKRQYHRPPAMHSAAQALKWEDAPYLRMPRWAEEIMPLTAGPNVWFEDGDMDQWTPTQFIFPQSCYSTVIS